MNQKKCFISIHELRTKINLKIEQKRNHVCTRKFPQIWSSPENVQFIYSCVYIVYTLSTKCLSIIIINISISLYTMCFSFLRVGKLKKKKKKKFFHISMYICNGWLWQVWHAMKTCERERERKVDRDDDQISFI